MSSGLINNGRTSIPTRVVSNEQKKELAKKLKYQRDKDRELVRGVFRYYEVPNGVLEFSYKAYREDPVETYQLYDGQVYTIPLGVARHLNKNVAYPKYEYIKGEPDVASGYNNFSNQGLKIRQKEKRCSFQSLEFLDIEDLDINPKQIIEVEQVLMNG